ncbi:MAG: molecular chaperone [Acetatifactor sp.]|nr:molecular chaperone [Acetatifactor sp.]
MDKYTYTLNQKNRKEENHHYYTREQLELMTTYQLRDICWKEQIINGIQAPLDKEELIRQIMRFRGRKENLYILEQNDEGWSRLEELLHTAVIHSYPQTVKGCAKIVAYEGLAIDYFDHFTIGYRPEIVNTNALLVSGGQICAILQIEQFGARTDCLYLTKSAEIKCRESAVKSYQLYCMEQAQSEWLYRLYESDYDVLPEHLNFYMVPVMDFQVRELLQINMPLAIDFGTTNTTAGTYLDSGYIERLEGDPVQELLRENDVNYVTWLKEEGEDKEESPILPSVVGITRIDGDQVHYVFGHEANKIFQMSYIDEGFCIFYDIKRWISDPDKQEELVDKNGHRCFVKRKEIIKAFLEYVIACATQRFKCRFDSLHLSAPVKQKKLFVKLYQEILPDYHIEEANMLDEGVAVLYNSISELISEGKYRNNEELRALIIDCGGGTTDLSSCHFSIRNQRVAYRINIATAYENGDTDFGGNNLTYRIMQVLKIALAAQLGEAEGDMPEEIVEQMGDDIFRRVDADGIGDVYRLLDEEYAGAEEVIPTRFREYEHRSNSEYYAVKNNFYYLFNLAEQIKKIFYGREEILRIAISGVPIRETATKCLLADRFKLSVREQERLTLLKDIPTVYFSINLLNRLLQADIYGIVKRFIENSYESGELQEYSIMRLTGQSCKIHLFREALKEFIPGKIIQSSKRERNGADGHEMKLICLDGAIKYIKDQKFGYADIHIVNEHAAFPYIVTAITHTGEEKVLIQSLDRNNIRGFISRNMADLTLQLYLKDASQNVRYKYNYSVNAGDFVTAEADDILEKYHGEILQDDLDSIVNRELKFFVLGDEERWGFVVVPVLRKEEQLMLGPDHFFLFETDSWLTNFFDGTK